MEVDVTTYNDLSVFHSEEEFSIFHKLNFTKTEEGKDWLYRFFKNPFSDAKLIVETQNIVRRILENETEWPTSISNGTIMVITRHHPIHALLYLVVSFLAIAMIFVAIGAPFVGVLEVIIYAGAIMVLFIFVVMMLNLDKVTSEQEKQWLKPNIWLVPSLLSVLLLGEMIYLLLQTEHPASDLHIVEPKQVSHSLFGK